MRREPSGLNSTLCKHILRPPLQPGSLCAWKQMNQLPSTPWTKHGPPGLLIPRRLSVCISGNGTVL